MIARWGGAVACMALLGAGSAGTADGARLEAGAATVTLRVPPGTPLGGYGSAARRLLFPDLLGRAPHAFWFRAHDGVLDPLAARALVVDDGTSRLVWIAADLVAVDESLRREVREALTRAGLTATTLILSASHTHSGPGAFIDSALFGFLVVDRQDAAVRSALVRDLVDAARAATLAKRPARAGTAEAPGPELTRSRLGRPVDREIVVMKLVSETDAPLALVWNYAIHGTMLGPRNRRLSGDVMGVASREIERAAGVPALFVNGAVGDVSPRHHGARALREDAAELAAAVGRVAARATGRPVERLRVASARVDLGSPALSVRNCTGRWIPRSLRLPLGKALPRDAELTAVALGDTAWVTIPGELQAALGETIKKHGASLWAHAFVAGLSNDYLGYFVEAGDYDRVSYVTCATLYGAEAGERIVRGATDLLRSLRAATAAR